MKRYWWIPVLVGGVLLIGTLIVLLAGPTGETGAPVPAQKPSASQTGASQETTASSVRETASSQPVRTPETPPEKEPVKPIPLSQKNANRVLVWSDEFDGDTLDKNKWCFIRSMNGNDRIYNNDAPYVTVSGGKLHLVTDHSGNPDYPYILPEGLSTRDTMNFKYGYLEMRGCVPFRHAAWPSFWLQTATPFSKANYMAEIDIFEVFSSSNQLESAWHKWGNGIHTSAPSNTSGLPHTFRFKEYANLNNEYHTYGFSWDEKEMCCYVDGVMFACFPITEADDFDTQKLPGMQGFHDFAYVLFNNELFSKRGGWVVPGWNAEPDEEMPIHYYIDWVRLYQDPSCESLYLSNEIAAAKSNKRN